MESDFPMAKPTKTTIANRKECLKMGELKLKFSVNFLKS